MESSDLGVVLGPRLRQQVPQSCEQHRDLFSFLGKRVIRRNWLGCDDLSSKQAFVEQVIEV